MSLRCALSMKHDLKLNRAVAAVFNFDLFYSEECIVKVGAFVPHKDHKMKTSL
ncbi:unnamed protein product [Amoebophrya sp. A120]|nr:unnamed protein product [Amoebophrya sp. A120]|eukprot:GSA120T00000715001.1